METTHGDKIRSTESGQTTVGGITTVSDAETTHAGVTTKKVGTTVSDHSTFGEVTTVV